MTRLAAAFVPFPELGGVRSGIRTVGRPDSDLDRRPPRSTGAVAGRGSAFEHGDGAEATLEVVFERLGGEGGDLVGCRRFGGG